MADKNPQRPKSYLDDKAFAELEKAGNVKLSVARRVELNDAISYSIQLRDWHEAYSPGAMKARTRVVKVCREFKRALSALDKPAYLSIVLSDDEGQVHFMEPSKSKANPQQFMDQLDAIIGRSELAAPENLERRRGPPKDSHLERLLKEVVKIYERSGRRAAIGGNRSGPFARFIRSLNDYIPRGYRAASGDALIKRAQDVLKSQKPQT